MIRQALADLRGVTGRAAYDRRTTWRGRPLTFTNRGPDARMGRHGGGWEFELGVQLGRRGARGTVIVSLGRGYLRLDPRPAASRT